MSVGGCHPLMKLPLSHNLQHQLHSETSSAGSQTRALALIYDTSPSPAPGHPRCFLDPEVHLCPTGKLFEGRGLFHDWPSLYSEGREEKLKGN